jgi:hypothetical protein
MLCQSVSFDFFPTVCQHLASITGPLFMTALVMLVVI